MDGWMGMSGWDGRKDEFMEMNGWMDGKMN